MRIAYLVPSIHDMGGTASAIATQASAMARFHDVEVYSVYRETETSHFPLAPGIPVHDLVDLTGDQDESPLRGAPPLLNRAEWDPTLDALAEVALEAALPTVTADVLVTVTPALLALATQLVPSRTALVHQEHRSSSQRVAGLEPLLTFGPRADVVAMLTEPMAVWLREQLGDNAPRVVVMPNAVPPGYRPRSTRETPLIVAAGRLMGEKQYPRLVSAFATIADRIPDWRLRILGEGTARFEIMSTVRKHRLWDRVELPGPTTDMASEWAKASISALTSRSEGFPLVLQEAMAAGVPVVSFDCPSGPRAIIDDGVDGLLVAQGSEPALAAGLLRLATDRDLRDRLGEAALAKAATWDVEVITARWREVYETTVEHHDPSRRGTARLRARHAAAVAAPPAPAPGVTPAQARAEALRAASAAAAAACDDWFVIPPHADETVLVVPMSARRAFLDALAAGDLAPYLSLVDPELRGWPERRGTPGEIVPALRRGRTSVLMVEPWPTTDGRPSLLAGCGLRVEFWEEDADGEMHTPGPARFATHVPRGGATSRTRVQDVDVPTFEAMVGPTPEECRFPVDVVYTWVDGSDPEWDAGRRRRLAESTDEAVQSPAASGQARYLERGELRASMRSVHLFAPWVRRIHLVTAGQVPAWLDTEHPMVRVVDHRELLPPEALPTFSSHAIETALHRIDGLAEHFLYLNDDMVLGRPTRPERWFSPAGACAVFPSSGVLGLPGQDDLPYLHAAANNRRLLQEAFGVTTTRTLLHAPYAHRVSVLEEITERFADAVGATARSPFRSETDVSLLSSLAQHYGLITGTAYVGEIDYTFVNLTVPDVKRRLTRLLDREQDSFCLGDHHDFARPREVVDQMVAETLEAYVPVPAPWERPL
ncbi:stealth conserved region 3 domain-containing protein [Nocardioides sp. cx-173]|uniref:stealth conserved region 3 domain-containing protein n=1 Tax=Nocardioides sp. cx-173 TaxID=2898796 RepID=UPI001E52EE42|nr:stealth conserved region 3 domain-containing protein [Nocardioides sp. cx-173]MCD4526707.1 stealth conserved region 3 domain-containing protein [Nocardioides sp. cx-173]UGB42551.1 stealth conserved region 3 domain-containing protein [Nocardioides sp. cx-173]